MFREWVTSNSGAATDLSGGASEAIENQRAIGLPRAGNDHLLGVLQPEGIGLVQVMADGNVVGADQSQAHLIEVHRFRTPGRD